jgi:hypothetical protein
MCLLSLPFRVHKVRRPLSVGDHERHSSKGCTAKHMQLLPLNAACRLVALRRLPNPPSLQQHHSILFLFFESAGIGSSDVFGCSIYIGEDYGQVCQLVYPTNN